MDGGTVWACANEGDKIYEGDYSIFTRERRQTKFAEYYLGDSFIMNHAIPCQNSNGGDCC